MKAKFYNEEKKIKVPRFEEREGFYTTPSRSKNMAQIRSKNTLPELLLRRALWAKNIRYRIHQKKLPGSPDLAIKKYKLAIFVDGDFWHGYQWAQRRESLKSNKNFWIPKIERNMQKDKIANAQLNSLGFTVMRFWEHEIKLNLAHCINQISLYIEAAQAGKIPSSE